MPLALASRQRPPGSSTSPALSHTSSVASASGAAGHRRRLALSEPRRQRGVFPGPCAPRLSPGPQAGQLLLPGSSASTPGAPSAVWGEDRGLGGRPRLHVSGARSRTWRFSWSPSVLSISPRVSSDGAQARGPRRHEAGRAASPAGARLGRTSSTLACSLKWHWGR